MVSIATIFRYIRNGTLPPSGIFPEALLEGLAHMCSFRGRFSKLTPIERLLTTMRFKEPDRVPCATLVGGAFRQLSGASFREFSQDPDVAIAAGSIGFDLIGGDVHLVGLDLSVEASDFGQRVIYPENSTAQPDYSRPLLTDWTDYRKIRPIQVITAPRMQKVLRLSRMALKRVGLNAALAAVVSSPLSVLCMLRGTEEVFKDCIRYPNDIIAALDTITGVLIEYIHALCETGLMVIVLDMLFAARSGLGKKLWEKIEGPFGRAMADEVRRNHCSVGIHNCGDGPYFDSLISYMAPDSISFACLPDDCSTRRDLKHRYGKQTVLVGNIDTGLLYYGTPWEVMEECRRIIDDLADGGGFILAPGCEYPPNANLMNAMAIVLAAERYG